MDHKVWVEKDSNYSIVTKDSTEILVWEYSDIDGLLTMSSLTPTSNGSEYKSSGTSINKDGYMLLKQDTWIHMLRVGKPDPLVIGYTGTEGESHTFVQYDMDGVELGNGNMFELVAGFYAIDPISDVTSYFILDGETTVSLVLPYPEDGSLTGVIRLQSAEQQYISLPVSDKTIAEYFVDGVCTTLGMAEADVFQVLKSLPSTESASGTFKVYKPGTTNRASTNNFLTSGEDSDGVKEYRSFLCITKDFGSAYVDFPWNSTD